MWVTVEELHWDCGRIIVGNRQKNGQKMNDMKLFMERKGGIGVQVYGI
jgi:hypothetical protein